MAVTNAQVAALRSYLVEDAEEEVWARQHEQLLHHGNLDDYAALVYSASVTAARRRFSPTWTQADVIRSVADLRAALAEEAEWPGCRR